MPYRCLVNIAPHRVSRGTPDRPAGARVRTTARCRATGATSLRDAARTFSVDRVAARCVQLHQVAVQRFGSRSSARSYGPAAPSVSSASICAASQQWSRSIGRCAAAWRRALADESSAAARRCPLLGMTSAPFFRPGRSALRRHVLCRMRRQRAGRQLRHLDRHRQLRRDGLHTRPKEAHR